MKTKFLLSTCVAMPLCGLASTCLAQSAAIIDSYGGSALENAGAVTVTVAQSGKTNTGVSVDYITKDGTGKAGVDYKPVSGTLAFAAGETEKTISILLAG